MTSFSAGQLSLAIDTQSVTLESPAGSWLGITATVVTSDARAVVAGLEVISQEDSEEGLEVKLTGSCDYGQLRLRIGVSAVEPVAIIWLDLLTSRSLDLHSITLTGVVSGQFDRFWKQGWQSWSPAYVTPLAGADESLPDRVLRGFGDFAEGLTSFDVGLLAGSQGALCAGFLTADRFLGSLNVLDGSLACSWLAASAAVEQDELLSFEPLRIELSSDPQRALERYAAAVAEVTSTDLPEVVPSGWCSWYYYYTAVTEADVLTNLRFLAEHRRELPVQFVQLDDGYQADIGDWRDWNDKFPGGPRRITEAIHDASLKAGLWLAPFLAGENSKLATEHPDWLVRDSAGSPVVSVGNWDQANYALDLTHPAVREWLRDLFIEIFEDWNFDYVKIDFVFAGALPGRRHDPRQTPIEAYREGLAIIRRAAGERFVLGCGAPQLPSVGLVDGMRIGPDVAPWWRARGPRDAAGAPTELPRINSAPAAEAAIRNTLQRAWSHGRLWLNDPDCILARDTQTKLTAAEIESLATVIGLSAGMILLSDNLPELSEQALRTLSFILPPLPEPAAVRGVLDSDLPGRMEFDAGQRLVVALFNWDDEEQDLTLRVTEAEVLDVWAGTYLGSASGQLILPSVPPHGCRLLALTPVDGQPRVLASSFHIGQGIHEIESEEYDPASNALALRLRPVPLRSGSLWLRWPFETVQIDGPADAHTLKDGILRIDLTIDQATELILRPGSRSPRRGG